MQAVSKGLEKVEQELTGSENDGVISAGFQKIYIEVDKFGEELVKHPEKSLPSLFVTINGLFSKLEASIGHFYTVCQSDSSVDGSYSFPLMFEKFPEVNQEGSQWTDCEIRDAINLIYENLHKLDSYLNVITLEGLISQEKFEKSRAYSLDKSHFHFVHEFVTILMDSAILFFGVLPWFWKRSGNFLVYMGLNAENEIVHTLAFLAGVMFWSQITDLPFSLYSTFVIEARHGFNKQTIWLFIRDMIKGIILAIVIGPPIVAAIIVIVQKGGPYLAIYLWGFMLVLSLVMMTVYPVLIAPLFNKFTPLPDGELRLKIEDLASSLKFPLKKLFVVDGSTRSSHSNAYMYGFFKNKRIVLYDTLIQQCKNVEEVVAVIAHELGHWKLNHTMYSFIAVQILTFLQFGGYTLVRNSKDLFQSFGFDTQPVLIGLIIFQHTVIPLQHLVSFGLNLVSRSFEFQADAFAKKLGYASPLRAGLVKLQEENLSAMNTDPWYSAYHYSHPPLVERLAAIDEPDKKED